MPPKREIKKTFIGDSARAKALEGARRGYEVVSSTYGPAGNNVILGMKFGDPTVTRDGVTVAKRVILEDKAEDDAWQVIRQASEKTNKTAGDGTTATVVLAYQLLKHGSRYVAAGEKGMLLAKQIVADSLKVIDFLKKESQPGKDHLIDVATVSAGDAAIGRLVSDTLEEIGTEGGISIREQNYPTVDVEKVNGYYFDKGFFALNQQVEYARPLIFVTKKQLSANQDVVSLLSRVIKGDNKNLIIIGDVRVNSEAMDTLLLNVMQGKLNAVVIPPPAYGDESTLFLEDIATYVGSTLFTPADDPKNIQEHHFGTADRAQIKQDAAIIFKGAGSADDITDRASQIQRSIASETSAHRKDQLEQRFAKLTGKIAIINVGGSTLASMEELRYRVEDAIEATKSAMTDGVLPGSGTMLVRAMELDLSPVFKDALQSTFSKLMTNAAESADYRLEQIRRAKPGHGFNLRDMTDTPIDLSKAGIWDATRAVIQTVENATDAAATLLKIGAIVDPIEDEEKKES